MTRYFEYFRRVGVGVGEADTNPHPPKILKIPCHFDLPTGGEKSKKFNGTPMYQNV
jgi:hypothetical protein